MEANFPAGQAPPLPDAARKDQIALAIIRTRPPRAREIFHRLRPIAVAAVALAFASIAAGVSYQFIKLRADARRFPQEGRRVDLGGYKLNINCTGQGSPTVVLEAGLGVPAISWRGAQ